MIRQSGIRSLVVPLWGSGLTVVVVSGLRPEAFKRFAQLLRTFWILHCTGIVRVETPEPLSHKVAHPVDICATVDWGVRVVPYFGRLGFEGSSNQLPKPDLPCTAAQSKPCGNRPRRGPPGARHVPGGGGGFREGVVCLAGDWLAWLVAFI